MIGKKSLLSATLTLILIVCIFAAFMHMNSRLSTIERFIHGLPNKAPVTIEQDIPEDYRSFIEEYLEKNVEKIVKRKHPVGGKWIITKRLFLSANTMRLDYEDGHELGQLILVIEDIKEDKIKYKILWQSE